MLGYEPLEQALQSLSGPEGLNLTIGFSGGLDSSVLLHWLCEWQKAYPRVGLRAIHINHQLQHIADKVQAHCESECARLGIPLISESVTVDRSQASFEQAARLARYQAIAQHMNRNDVLVLAHHRDDQVETLMQRLARGSGPLGLSAMKVVSTSHDLLIVRPLLTVDRSEIEQYARLHQLNWIEDPSNADLDIDRNYLRHRILPAWRQQKPDLNRTLARVSRLCEESAQLLAQLGALDAGEPRSDNGLAIEQLRPLNAARQANLLRYWLQQLGVAMPSEAVLQAIRSDVVMAASDANPQVNWGQVSIRRFQGVLYRVPLGILSLEPAPQAVQFDQLCNLPKAVIKLGHGSLSAESGQCLTLFSKKALAQAPLRLGYRQGGEHVRPTGRHDKRLKDWFQILGVPPWLRDLWPILYCGDQIAGLPGLLVSEDFQSLRPDDAIKVGWHWSFSLIESEQ